MKVLFVADPLEKINPRGDSSLAMVRALLQKGHKVYWTIDRWVEWVADGVMASARAISDCVADELPQFRERASFDLGSMDAVLIRKDPPFDENYIRLCWLLALEEERVWIMNRPSLLLRYHEKLIPLEAYRQGFLDIDDIISTYIGNITGATDYARSLPWDQIISKPFLGYAGKGIELHEKEAFVKQPPKRVDDGALVQPFHQKVQTQGDRRVFLLGGEVIADVVRMPQSGGFVSNFAQGGTGIKLSIPDKEKRVLERLGGFLRKTGLVLAGADLIDGRLSEVNVTSPTGLRAFETLDGHDYAVDIANFIERSVAQQ